MSATANPAYAAAHQAAIFANSYTRLDTVMTAMGSLTLSPDWFQLLGEHWSTCDNIYRWRTALRRILSEATRDQLDAMMTSEERTALAVLPPRITVYRGCYRVNRAGLSWSLDRACAETFPTLMRYARHGEQPLLLTAVVPRASVVLKLDRREAEIIVAELVRPVFIDTLKEAA